MKTIVIIIVCFFSVLTTQSQTSAFKTTITEGTKKNDFTLHTFQFNYSGEKPWTNYDDYSKKDEKIFGKRIAQQFSLIDHCSISFSKSGNEYRPNIINPSIYNSLIKLKHYYRDILRNPPEDTVRIKLELETFLIKGYLCYSQETQELEELFQKADTVEEIINILNSIELVNPLSS